MWRMILVTVLASLTLAACAGGPSDEEELAQRLARFQDATFAVEYEAILEGPEVDDNLSRVIWYQQGQRTRVDYYATEGPTTVVVREDKSYLCDHLTVLTSGGCEAHPQNNVPLLSYTPVAYLWSETHRPQDFIITGSHERTIAGQEATCFGLKPGPRAGSTTAESELCLSVEGLLLSGRVHFRDPVLSTTLTATQLSSSVAENTFEPPFAVTGESELCETGAFRC